jgi:hypothetical protein
MKYIFRRKTMEFARFIIFLAFYHLCYIGTNTQYLKLNKNNYILYSIFRIFT